MMEQEKQNRKEMLKETILEMKKLDGIIIRKSYMGLLVNFPDETEDPKNFYQLVEFGDDEYNIFLEFYDIGSALNAWTIYMKRRNDEDHIFDLCSSFYNRLKRKYDGDKIKELFDCVEDIPTAEKVGP